MSSHANPFRPGSGLQPPYLAGRDGELARFSQMLLQVQEGQVRNLMVQGLRGVGKTVLLKEFVKICADNKFLPVTRLQFSSKHSDPAEFTRALQHDLDNTMGSLSRVEKTKQKLQDAARQMKPQKIDVMGVGWEFKHDSASRVPLENQITDYLEKWWKVVQESGYNGIVLLFDEFHMVNDVKPNNWYILTDFIGAINEIQSNGCRYSLVLCGLPTLMPNVKAARSYAERMFSVVNVSNLDKENARAAISKPLEDTIWSFSDDLVSAIVRDTDSYPYFIQFFCSEIILRAGKEHVTLDDYEKIKDQLTGDLGRDFFDQRIEPLSAAQRRVLYSAASLPDLDLEFSSIQKSLNVGKGALSSHLKRLEEKGLIYRSGRGTYRLAMPLLGKYLRLRMQSE